MTKASRYKLARDLGKTKFKPTPTVNVERPSIKPLALLVKAVIAGHSLAYKQLAAIQAEEAGEGDQL